MSRWLRPAALGGALSVVTGTLGWLLGGFAQPAAYSAVHDDISDLGALTAASPWLYNQLAANLTGLLVVGLAAALWAVLSPDLVGRLGALALAVGGAGTFLDGLFRLDCRGIDSGCHNSSWHAHAHKLESGVTAGALIVSPLILALAFRRNPQWRDAWLPTALAVPALFAANVVFSIWGDGAATRAGTVVILLWVAYVGVNLLRKLEGPLRPAPSDRPG